MRRPPDAEADGRPRLALADEDREVVAELLAELLVEGLELSVALEPQT
jgi:hypothetical protein